MHRTLAAAVALALPIAVLSTSAASAAEAPKKAKPSSKAVVLRTDAMPTKVTATTASGRLLCVKIAAGAGRDRRVWLTLDGERADYVRLRARSTSDCLLEGVSTPKGTSLGIVVEEDVLGPFNPRDKAKLVL